MNSFEKRMTAVAFSLALDLDDPESDAVEYQHGENGRWILCSEVDIDYPHRPRIEVKPSYTRMDGIKELSLTQDMELLDVVLADGSAGHGRKSVAYWKGENPKGINYFTSFHYETCIMAYLPLVKEKEEPEVIPWTFMSAPDITRVIHKETHAKFAIVFFETKVKVFTDKVWSLVSYAELAAQYLTTRGNPCGTLKGAML